MAGDPRVYRSFPLPLSWVWMNWPSDWRILNELLTFPSHVILENTLHITAFLANEANVGPWNEQIMRSRYTVAQPQLYLITFKVDQNEGVVSLHWCCELEMAEGNDFVKR